MVEVASLKLRVGDVRGARQLTSSLQSMSYRYPAFTRSRLPRAGS
jgi:hypothetical protein